MRKDAFFQPVSALEMPRFAGMPSFMRLPHLTMDSQEINRLTWGLLGCRGTLVPLTGRGRVMARASFVIFPQ